jgi:hypothetical protein
VNAFLDTNIFTYAQDVGAPCDIARDLIADGASWAACISSDRS